MLKTRIIATFIVLFAFIFTYLHATPLPRAVDRIVAVFKKLDGKVEFASTDEGNSTFSGVFNKGFDENAPDRYFMDLFFSVKQHSFDDLKIPN
ncbi:hypothetical protein F8M41_014637 [Gigaspora margarita]|uniref:Uncharacterized protein n=1 Tax=Gigaspora margarita TaxID=4874 RepID=A0A8H4ENK0_GIGMA|nr:hypothetical protein F8M41_014637 [Gigaspora margarita]